MASTDELKGRRLDMNAPAGQNRTRGMLQASQILECFFRIAEF